MMIEHAPGHVWAVEPPRSKGTWTSFMVEGVDTASMALPPRRLRRAPMVLWQRCQDTQDVRRRRRRQDDGRRKTSSPKAQLSFSCVFYFWPPFFISGFFLSDVREMTVQWYVGFLESRVESVESSSSQSSRVLVSRASRVDVCRRSSPKTVMPP